MPPPAKQQMQTGTGGVMPAGEYYERTGKTRADLLAAQEQRQAAELWQHSGEASRLMGAQERGEGLKRTLGGLGVGGLAARGAIMGAGDASYAAGVGAARAGSQDRFEASGQTLQTMARQAGYEQQLKDIHIAKLQSDMEEAERKRRADEGLDAAEAEYTMQMIGTAAGAAGTAMAGYGSPSQSGGSRTAGGSPQAQSYYESRQTSSSALSPGSYRRSLDGEGEERNDYYDNPYLNQDSYYYG